MAMFYFKAGNVERPAKGGGRYTWRQGYNEIAAGRIVYPTVTRREAMEDARRNGTIARFYDDESSARAAIAKATA